MLHSILHLLQQHVKLTIVASTITWLWWEWLLYQGFICLWKPNHILDLTWQKGKIIYMSSGCWIFMIIYINNYYVLLDFLRMWIFMFMLIKMLALHYLGGSGNKFNWNYWFLEIYFMLMIMILIWVQNNQVRSYLCMVHTSYNLQDTSSPHELPQEKWYININTDPVFALNWDWYINTDSVFALNWDSSM